ncbi:hypothetical protein [Sandaracinus amylolyticus]|uniref:Muc19 n=1 Tax=Sandaracinus amylolyticus TaxID=927083 RepID=A0A0F6W5U9_9BACT|nr:hypothetical protein [Sandaracinus amylolyticus]AKF08040.1 Muc19 precursor [Sandaracinus amylolyticus]
MVLLALALVACGDDDGGTTPMNDAGGADGGGADAGGGTGDAGGGGGSDAGIEGDPFDAVQMAQVSLATTLCGCDYEAQGFASAEDCVLGNAGSTEARACDRAGWEAVSDEAAAETYFACQAHGARALSQCAADAECDAEALEECGGAECANPPEAIATAFLGAVAECVESTIVGTTASTCPEGETSSALGEAVFSGTTTLAGADLAGGTEECDGADAPDRAFRWTAPAAGTYVFDTIGSTFDTLLYLRAACDATENLACNDDVDVEAGNTRSRVMLTATEGQEVIVVVDGYSDVDAGRFVVNIAAATE